MSSTRRPPQVRATSTSTSPLRRNSRISAKSQVSAATTAFQVAEKAASAAEDNAKEVSEAEKQQAAADARAKRKDAEARPAAPEIAREQVEA